MSTEMQTISFCLLSYLMYHLRRGFSFHPHFQKGTKSDNTINLPKHPFYRKLKSMMEKNHKMKRQVKAFSVQLNTFSLKQILRSIFRVDEQEKNLRPTLNTMMQLYKYHLYCKKSHVLQYFFLQKCFFTIIAFHIWWIRNNYIGVSGYKMIFYIL